MTKEIENIILKKKFFELTAEEKNLIQEFAETEVDLRKLKESSVLKNRTLIKQ